MLAQIWKDTLGIEGVGLHNNLFDLGVTSPMVADIADRIREAFKRDVHVTDLLAHPTISSLAIYLSAAGDDGSKCETAARRA